MVKKRRVKKSVKIIGSIFIIAIIFLIMLTNYLIKINSIDYKLKEKGYNDEEITSIKANLDENKINDILKLEYDENLPKLISQKYFIYDKLNLYLDYSKENKLDAKKVISLVNANTYKDHYTDIVKTDTSLNELLIVNKYYQLSSDYEREDLIEVPTMYAYSGIKLSSVAYEAFKELFNAAKSEGYTIVINSGYRSYDSQEAVYNRNKNNYGTTYADNFVARPGHSEHQTGLAVDVADYENSSEDFEKTEAYQWMLDNAHKYGFILRYPKDKEDITGYSFESWHFRYVGVDIATKIHSLDITYDEYYTYFIENK